MKPFGDGVGRDPGLRTCCQGRHPRGPQIQITCPGEGNRALSGGSRKPNMKVTTLLAAGYKATNLQATGCKGYKATNKEST